MADNTLGRTAEEFRTAVRLAAERGNLGPAANPGVTPLDADALAAAVEARLSEAVGETVRREMAGQTALTAIDPQLVARLEAAAEQRPNGDSDVMLHLQNILPGQMRQEMHQQNQLVIQRMAALETQLAAVQADNGLGRDLIRIALTGLVVAIILIGVTIFERQIQNWGRDAIYPLFGISIKEATSAPTATATPSAPRQAR